MLPTEDYTGKIKINSAKNYLHWGKNPGPLATKTDALLWSELCLMQHFTFWSWIISRISRE